MKLKNKLITLISVTLLSCQPAYASLEKESTMCEDLKGIAKSSMYMRQEGVSKYQVKTIVVTPTTEAERQATEVINHVIDMVYQLPIYKDESNKKLAIETISNYVYLTCVGE